MSCAETEYMPCGCKAHLFKEDHRVSLWRYALGSLEFPLRHPISHMGKAEGEHSAKFLEGDWAALSEDQKFRMCKKMMQKFGIPRSEFEKQIRALGYMPIKDENIILVIYQKHSRMLM